MGHDEEVDKTRQHRQRCDREEGDREGVGITLSRIETRVDPMPASPPSSPTVHASSMPHVSRFRIRGLMALLGAIVAISVVGFILVHTTITTRGSHVIFD